jgi:type I restriction-modification system DNA methylase subunit/restriction endonuclease S subunit
MINYSKLFHSIHCILRNGELGLTGLTALNEINNIIFIIFNIQNKFNIEMDEKITFKYVYNNYVKKYKIEKLDIEKNKLLGNVLIAYCDILECYIDNDLINKYFDSDSNKISSFRSAKDKETDPHKFLQMGRQVMDIYIKCGEILFNNKSEITDEDIAELFKNINYDILGDAYEKFKEDDVGNQGKTVGQYFTPRTVIKYIIENLIKPKYNELCYDSSCGTGGFIHFLNKFIVDNEKDEENRNKFKMNIYANDKTAEIIKPLYINMFLHNISIDNIKCRNSLSFKNCEDYFEMFDIIVGNPPYGVRIEINKDDFKNFKNTKYNYYPSFMIKNKGSIKDSTAQFIIHTINSLKVNGRFCLVIDRGCINNGSSNTDNWQRALRKYILTVCDIEKIILLPKGIFTHTQFDTLIIYGIKKISFDDYNKNQLTTNYSTKSIEYYQAEFENKDKKTGFIVDKPIINLKMINIIKKDFSLKLDDYIKKEDTKDKKYKYEKLIDNCEFKNIKVLKDDETSEDGIYPYFNSSIIENKKSNKYTDEDEVLLINKVNGSGKCKIYYNNGKYTASSAVIIFKPKDENINIKYLYYYLNIYRNEISKLYEGGDKKSLKKSLFENFEILILPLEDQEEIVKNMDDIINENYKILDRMIEEFKDIDIFKLVLKKRFDTFNLAVKYIELLIDYENNRKKIFDLQRKGIIKCYKGKYEKLGDICEINIGKTPETKNIEYWKDGNNKWISISDMKDKYIEDTERKITDKAILESKIKKIPKDTLVMSFKMSLGKLAFLKSDMYSNEAICSLKPFDKVNKYYLYEYLKVLDYKSFTTLLNGGISKSFNTSSLHNIPIYLPSQEDQERIIKEIEKIDEEEVKYIEDVKKNGEMVRKIYNNMLEMENEKIKENELFSEEMIEKMEECIKNNDKDTLKKLMKEKGIEKKIFNEKLKELQEKEKEEEEEEEEEIDENGNRIIKY